MIPLSLLFMAVSLQLVQVVYGYGEFDPESIQKTAECLKAYTIGLLPSTFILIFASAFYSQDDYRTPAIGSIMTMVCNLITNSLFIFVFGLGTVSVALSTSLSAFVNALYLQRRLPLPRYSGSVLRTTLASVAAYTVTIFIPDVGNSFFDLILKSGTFFAVLTGTGYLLKAKDMLFWETKIA